MFGLALPKHTNSKLIFKTSFIFAPKKISSEVSA
jgi:hypothetical protein